MVPNQSTDSASNVEQTGKSQSRAQNGARKVKSKAGTRRGSSNRNARGRPSKRSASTRSLGLTNSVLDDAYGMARASSKKVSRVAREAGLPNKYANDRALILAAVGLSVSMAFGALIMGYRSFGSENSEGSSQSSRKRGRR
jgi:hypothetical protein